MNSTGSSMHKKRILFYSTPSLSTFSKKDIEILGDTFSVHVFIFNPRFKWLTPVFLIKQLWQIIIHFKASVYVTQFGGYHSLIPSLVARLKGGQSYIITGGTDCVSFPLLGYGNFTKKVLGFFTCLSFRLSHRILPVHDSLVNSMNTYDPMQSGPQGMLSHCRGLNTPFTVIHNGYEADEWRPDGMKNPLGFITVAGGAASLKRFRLKGLDLIFEIANDFPECSFTIVGCTAFDFEIQVPKNIHLVDFADQSKLLDLFGSNQFYLQLSISEGFPNAVCEAMLCGCIPIGSTAGALPDIIGDTGLILIKRDTQLLRVLIREALQLNPENGMKARNRIEEHYPLSRRRKILLDAIL